MKIRVVLERGIFIWLISAGLVSAFNYWRSVPEVQMHTDAATLWESRMTRIREKLPIQRGTVGYIADWDVPGISYAYWDQEGEYMLTQYTLAPLILRRGAADEWNVAVFSEEALAGWQAMHPGEFEITHSRFDVYILHKVGGQ